MNKYTYTLWLVNPKGEWLYEWANVFRSAEAAREYRDHLSEGLHPGFEWKIVEKEPSQPSIHYLGKMEVPRGSE